MRVGVPALGPVSLAAPHTVRQRDQRKVRPSDAGMKKAPTSDDGRFRA
jgi:hypothetical protein